MILLLEQSADFGKFDKLWESIASASWYGQTVLGIIGLVAIVLFFAFVSGKLPKLFDIIFRGAQKKKEEIDKENWLSSSISKAHKMPRSVSFTKSDIKLQMIKYSKDIDALRNQPVPGKEYVLDFSDTAYISEDCFNAFIKFIKEGMDKNVVKLVILFSTRPAQGIKKFRDKCQVMEKKHKTNSFVVRSK